MRIFYDIVDDLYRFVLQTTERFCMFILENSTESGVQTEETRANEEVHGGIIGGDLVEIEEEIPAFKRIDAIIENRKHEQGTLMYVLKQDAPLFKNQTIEFDGVLSTVSYGAVVTGGVPHGRFMHVHADGKEGWMFRDDLITNADQVYPRFKIGEPNGCDDENTIKLRACIRDAFAGSLVEYPLQAGEYVLYQLKRRGVPIAWPDDRPRTPGRWHVILRGVPGVRITVIPTPGAIMEYMVNEGIGHVAYVSEVSPHGAISVSETHYPDHGIYNERTLNREEWLALRPVFLEIA